MTGRPGPNTRRLIVEAGGFLYDRDLLADELPIGCMFREIPPGHPLFVRSQRQSFQREQRVFTGQEFFTYMRDAFDVLYARAERLSKLLSLVCMTGLIGRPTMPGRSELLEHMRGSKSLWFCRGIDIAQHWLKHFPAKTA